MNARKVRNAAVTAGLCLSMAFGTLPVTAIAEQAQDAAPTASQEAAAQHKFSFVDADHGNDTVGGWTTTLDDALSYNPVDGTHEWRADGYKFLGWSVENDGTVDKYGELEGLSGDITLYAVWQKADSSTNQQDSVAHVKYYDSLNDTYEWEQTAINGLGWYFDPQANGAMTHDGYTFAGWSYDPQGNYLVSEDTTLAAGDINLYAQWTKNEASATKNVTYRDSMGDWTWGQTVTGSDGWNFNSEANGAVSHEGYTFAGWAYNQDGSDPVTDENIATLTGDVTVYAQWTKNGFQSNVKYYDSLNDTYEWEQTAINGLGWYFDPQANGAMTHDGYTFAGWSYDPQGNYPVSEDTTLAAGDIALYAQWKQNPLAKSHILFRDSLAEDFDSSLISEDTFDEGDVDWSTAVPTKDGYTFAGWAYNQDGSEPVAAGTVLPTGDVTLWAQWTKNEDPTVHATFVYRDSMDDKYDWSQSVDNGQNWYFNPEESGAMSHDGYTFAGWTFDKEGTEPVTDESVATLAGDVTVWAQWTKDAESLQTANFYYRDSLNDDYVWGPSTVVNGQGWNFNPQANGAMTHDGYTFAGWSFSKNGEIVSQEDVQNLTGDVTLYAVWNKTEVAKSRVYFRDSLAEDFDSSLISENTFDEGDVDWSTAVPTKDGYTFAGWAYNQDGSEPVAAGTVLPVGDVTLWAQWTKNPETLGQSHIYFRDSLAENFDSSLISDQTFAEGDTEWGANVPTRDGYTFAGWAYNQDGSEAVATGTVLPVGDVTLWAQWTKNEDPQPEPVTKHTVTFVNRGTVIQVSQVEDGQVLASTPQVDSVDGYTFVGWTTDQNSYTGFDFAQPITSDVVVYAWYTKNAVDNSDNTNVPGVQKTTNVESGSTTVDQGGAKSDDKSDDKALPQTSDSMPVAAVAGFGVLGSLVAAAGAFLKRRNN